MPATMANLMREIGLFLVLCCAASVPVFAQEPGDDAATAVRTLEHGWFEAQSHHDNHALDLIFDNALVYIEHGRLMTKGDYLLSVRSTQPQLQQIAMEATSVRMFGNTAIVVGVYLEKDAAGGKSLAKRRRFVDTWVYKKGHWMLVAAAAVPIAK